VLVQIESSSTRPQHHQSGDASKHFVDGYVEYHHADIPFHGRTPTQGRWGRLACKWCQAMNPLWDDVVVAFGSRSALLKLGCLIVLGSSPVAVSALRSPDLAHAPLFNDLLYPSVRPQRSLGVPRAGDRRMHLILRLQACLVNQRIFRDTQAAWSYCTIPRALPRHALHLSLACTSHDKNDLQLRRGSPTSTQERPHPVKKASASIVLS